MGLVPYICASLPPLWFFGFLYYTDMLGVWTILMSFAAMENQRHVQASFFGLGSLFFRQTNIIWLMFIVGVAVVREMQHLAQVPRHVTPPIFDLGFYRSIWTRLLQTVAPYAPVFFAFAAYIVWNDGAIVLGDKSHHEVTFHAAQVGYFFAFALAFSWPVLLPFARRRWRKVHMCVAALFLAVGYFGVRYGTIVHPFLLADNRHYTFYIWRRLINARAWTRYALVPIYVAGGMLCTRALAKTQSALWIFGWLVAVCMSLIPSPLIEPRYYLMPYLILRLYMPATSWMQEGVELLAMVIINTVTMTIFLQYPFTWPHEAGTQRFMW